MFQDLDQLLRRKKSFTVGIDTAQLNSIYAHQRSYNWCWAACIEMIGSYYGISINQEDLALSTCGSDHYGFPMDCPAHDHTITNHLNNCFTDWTESYCLTTEYYRGRPNLHRLKEELQRGNPVMIGYLPNGARTGHAVLVTAIEYYYIGNAIYVTKFFVRDPSPTTENRRAFGRQESVNAHQFYRSIYAHWYTSLEVNHLNETIFF